MIRKPPKTIETSSSVPRQATRSQFGTTTSAQRTRSRRKASHSLAFERTSPKLIGVSLSRHWWRPGTTGARMYLRKLLSSSKGRKRIKSRRSGCKAVCTGHIDPKRLDSSCRSHPRAMSTGHAQATPQMKWPATPQMKWPRKTRASPGASSSLLVPQRLSCNRTIHISTRRLKIFLPRRKPRSLGIELVALT